MLVSVLCDICVLYCRLNTFRRVLDAEMKDLTADGVALKTKRAEKVGISAEEERQTLCLDIMFFMSGHVYKITRWEVCTRYEQ